MLHRLFSSCGERGSLWSWCSGFSGLWLPWGRAQALGLAGFRSCGPPRLQSAGAVVVAPGLSCSAALGSSQNRDRTCVSCIGRQILYHWATREALKGTFLRQRSRQRVWMKSFHAMREWEKVDCLHQHYLTLRVIQKHMSNSVITYDKYERLTLSNP